MSFDVAVAKVLEHEGGYVDDPRDPGGETKYGISKRAYPALDIKHITYDDAKAIYKRDYWDALPDLPDRLHDIVFDCAVNTGVSRAVRLLQGAVGTNPDGKWGPASAAALQRTGEAAAIAKFCTERIMYYARLDTFPVYGKGWVKRVIDGVV